MLFGYPVEKLCTYQYSLVSLIPGMFYPFFAFFPSLHFLSSISPQEAADAQLTLFREINRTPLKSTRFRIASPGPKDK